MFAADVTLVNGSHDINSFSPFSGELIIGNGCWIGAGAKILGNVEIGEGAKVGAGSVVLKNVPPHCTVAGVPAIVVGKPCSENPAHDMNHEITAGDSI